MKRGHPPQATVVHGSPLLRLASGELRWLLVAALAAFAASVVIVQLAVGPGSRSASAPCPGQVLGGGAGLARVGALGYALSVIELAEARLQRAPADDPDRLAWASEGPRVR